ncbi:MAG: hypothetical protein HKN21_03935, partial [Candidatus Eisenbacteria bacterium]|nr:hypothetical protein [Candidatus Eisenbacteria bacterium]
HIPVGAGLGGGSSDAAATLVGLNELWGLELPETTLAALALELGSDVPFFLEGGTALGEGQGEQLTPLDGPPGWSWLLVIPDFSISTESAYLKASIGLTQSRQRLNMAQLALKSQDLTAFVDHWINDLEPGVWGSEPRLGEIAAAMESCGLPLAAMTGSGSVLFSIDSAGLSGEPVSDQAVSALKSREGIKDVLRCSSVSTGVLKTYAPCHLRVRVIVRLPLPQGWAADGERGLVPGE